MTEIVGQFVVFPAIGFARYATVALFWRWYVASVFHLPVLSLMQSAGFALLVTLLTFHFDASLKRDEYDAKKNLIAAFAILAADWMMAGIIHLLIALGVA